MSVRFRILLSSACAVLAVLACLAYAEQVRAEEEQVRAEALERFGGEVTKLVVASHPLEVGDVVSERTVSERDWIADLAPDGAITSLDDAIGREVRVPVASGAPLTELTFRDETVLAEVPAGHVAVSVPVTDKLGIARGVTRGARVSAYAVGEGEPRLIATDVQVLSELASTTGIVATQQVTIAVLPEDVADVLGASATGDLRLVIPADDVETVGDAGNTEPPSEVETGEED